MDDRLQILNRLSPWELARYVDLGGELPRGFERRGARLAEVEALRHLRAAAAAPVAITVPVERPRRYRPRGSLLVCHQRPDLRLTTREAAELAGVKWSTFRPAMAEGRQIGGMTFEWLDDVKERQGAVRLRARRRHSRR